MDAQSPLDGTCVSEEPHRKHSSANRFRFKSKSSKRHAEDDLSSPPRSTSNDPHLACHPQHQHRRRRRKHGRRLNPPEVPPTPLSDEPPYVLNSEVAFRESLFDAMGDDEGAAYWEAIYGQPIHIYSSERMNPESGELERMNEEEYIAFVRKGMWERSSEGIRAEKERIKKQKRAEKVREEFDHDRARKRKPSPESEAGLGASDFEMEIERSLKRGRERKEKKIWRERWESYEEGWDQLYHLADSGNGDTTETGSTRRFLRNEIIWPVASGSSKDLDRSEIETFMYKTADALAANEDLSSKQYRLLSNLKMERIRWHPDRVQHRFSTLNVDDATLRSVTAVFQAMDHLYNEKRGGR